jgi:TonB family protein
MRLMLLDSARPAHAAGWLGPTLSVAAHLVFVAAMTLNPTVEEQVQSFDEPLPEGLTFLVPPSAAPEVPMTELQYSEEGGGEGTPEGVKVEETGNRRAEQRGSGDTLTSTDVAQDDHPDPASAFASPATLPADVFMVVEVDSAATRDPTSAAPAYPSDMLAQRVPGYVAVRFVVDTMGTVDLTTVQVMTSSRSEFTRAVRDALPLMRFTPAKMGGVRVRQLAEQVFRFELPRPTFSPPPAPARRPVP